MASRSGRHASARNNASSSSTKSVNNRRLLRAWSSPSCDPVKHALFLVVVEPEAAELFSGF
eukprot:289941-Prymnesium_polylepis.1